MQGAKQQLPLDEEKNDSSSDGRGFSRRATWNRDSGFKGKRRTIEPNFSYISTAAFPLKQIDTSCMGTYRFESFGWIRSVADDRKRSVERVEYDKEKEEGASLFEFQTLCQWGRSMITKVKRRQR